MSSNLPPGAPRPVPPVAPPVVPPVAPPAPAPHINWLALLMDESGPILALAESLAAKVAAEKAATSSVERVKIAEPVLEAMAAIEDQIAAALKG